jgi:hypothetical protein
VFFKQEVLSSRRRIVIVLNDEMADITPDFNICLKDKGGQPVLKRQYDFEKINSFLQEAYNIVWSSSSEAVGYVSNSPSRMIA